MGQAQRNTSICRVCSRQLVDDAQARGKKTFKKIFENTFTSTPRFDVWDIRL
jgi:hypothetical protein